MRGELALVLVLVACQDLPRLGRDECGNGVVETDEDCDGATDPARGARTACAPPDHAAACRYVCGDASCPVGWACGDDGVCRHGTGELVADRAIALPHTELAIADFDGDGIGDIAGFDLRGARIAFGDRTVVAASPDNLTGPGTVADLDGDARADLAAPFALGIAVARGESDASVTAVGYAPFTAEKDGWFIPVRIPGTRLGDSLASVVPRDGGTALDLVLLPEGTTELTVPLSSVLAPAELGPTAVRADLDPPSDEDELVIAAPGHDRAWILRPTVSIFGTLGMVPEELRIPNGIGDGRVAIADLDGDGDLDILLGITTAAGSGVAVATNTGGGFAAPVATTQLDRLRDPAALPGVSSAPQPFPLAIGDLDGDGDLDAVSPDAVFLSNAGSLAPAFRRGSAAPWREAVIADVDRNGLLDVVVATHLSGLDVLRQGPGGFTRVTIDTAGPAALLRTGDFDGDALDDVAFRERTVGGDRIRVLFGGVGVLAPPAVVLGAPAITRFEIGRFRDARGTFELADDMVAVVRSGDRTRLAFVDGAGDRRLRSPLFLTRGGVLDSPVGVVAGRFFTPGPRPDLAVVATDLNGRRRLWVFPAAAEAAFAPERVVIASAASLGAFADLELRQLRAADLDGDGRDELVAFGERLDGVAIVVVLRVAPFEQSTSFVIEPALGSPIDLAAGDLDGDGDTDLVIAGSLGVASWRGGELARAPGLTANSICLAQLDDEPTLELVVLESDTLSVLDAISFAREGTNATAPARTTLIRAGDIDGDGVADVVAGDGAAVTPLRSVPQVPR